MKKYFRLVLTLVLLACFCLQVWDGFIKFVKRQTTVVSKKTVSDTLRLPAISFCPGFKRSDRDYYDRFDAFDELIEDEEDSLSPMDLWLNDTYDINEVLECLKAPGSFKNTPCVILNQTGFYNGLNITLHEVSTGYGRCYAIHFSSYLLTNPDQFFTLKFNMSQHKELFIYVHEDYNEVGQHWGYYPIEPIQVPIIRNAHYNFVVRKDLFRPSESTGCRKDEDYSLPKCVVDWARRRYVEMFAENNLTACWLPDTQYYAMGTGINECQSKDMAEWVRNATYNHVTGYLENDNFMGCAQRCVRYNLKLKIYREPNHSDESTTMAQYTHIYYTGFFEADEDEEVVLYDFNNILAAIGGSLGLFLGVSVFSIIVFIIDKCQKLAKKITRREIHLNKLPMRKIKNMQRKIKEMFN